MQYGARYWHAGVDRSFMSPGPRNPIKLLQRLDMDLSRQLFELIMRTSIVRGKNPSMKINIQSVFGIGTCNNFMVSHGGVDG